MPHRIWRAFLLTTMCVFLAGAQTPSLQSGTQPASSWLNQLWDLPIFHFFTFLGFDSSAATEPIASSEVPEMMAELPEPPPPPVCASVQPLDTIDDTEAKEFEAGVETGAMIDRDGLTPATSVALNRFETIVVSAGGTIELKSAFRPAAYQEHLQNVWDKWKEIRNNKDLDCEPLKAQVEAEFTRHRLIETQRPVAFSDHTRGLAFDALVSLPGRARLNRRRVTVDYLARISGVLRPAIAKDPVHFKLIGRRS